ncbi:MAG TPA: hypothetical protein VKF16_05840 [Candidatus Dormibacteraeota bacterium]|nr:hypothetical protein [Candidatus Dormibacteraeota bacterium]
MRPDKIEKSVGGDVWLYSPCLVRFRKLQPSVRFYAFEANPDTATRLARSAEPEEVVGAGIALSDRGGPLTFGYGSTSLTFGVAGSPGSQRLGSSSVQVEARRLDGLEIEGD